LAGLYEIGNFGEDSFEHLHSSLWRMMGFKRVSDDVVSSNPTRMWVVHATAFWTDCKTLGHWKVSLTSLSLHTATMLRCLSVHSHSMCRRICY